MIAFLAAPMLVMSMAAFLFVGTPAPAMAQPQNLNCLAASEARAALATMDMGRVVTGTDHGGVPFEIWMNRERDWILALSPPGRPDLLCVLVGGGDLRIARATDPPAAPDAPAPANPSAPPPVGAVPRAPAPPPPTPGLGPL